MRFTFSPPTAAAKASLAMGLALALSACASVLPPPAPPKGGSPPSTMPRSGAPIPPTPIDLGDYRVGSVSGVIGVFANGITRRYAIGETLGAVTADLRRNSFFCGRAIATRGAPPDQVCKRVIKVGECEHVWQVFAFDDKGNQRLVRVRSLYDRKCGPDALLGGPG